jgi:O-antigen ligase
VYSPAVAKLYSDWRGEPTADPHNLYMLIAMETGAFGLLAFAGILVTALACVRRNTMHAWIAAGALLGWMLTCLFNSHFRTFPESHMISLLLGAMLASGSDLGRSLFSK